VQKLEHQLDIIQSNPINQQLEITIKELEAKYRVKKEKLR